jgi:hypothetical protein
VLAGCFQENCQVDYLARACRMRGFRGANASLDECNTQPMAAVGAQYAAKASTQHSVVGGTASAAVASR